MTLAEIMDCQSFCVVGDTLNKEKYACKIKAAMFENGYQVYAVGKELPSINDVPGEIQVIDLCIHPVKGLKLLKECRKPYDCVLIQPGAESEELLSWLEENRIPFLQGCLLKGLAAYKNG